MLGGGAIVAQALSGSCLDQQCVTIPGCFVRLLCTGFLLMHNIACCITMLTTVTSSSWHPDLWNIWT